MNTATLDAQDAQILADRTLKLDAIEGPRCGDYLRMPDGELARVAHVYPADWDEMAGVQPNYTASNWRERFGEGSYYLGNGYVSMSGSLGDWIAASRLTLTEETREGSAWFFHRDEHRASNGVNVTLPFRVYEVSDPA